MPDYPRHRTNVPQPPQEDIARRLRQDPPDDYSIEINSFSLFSEKMNASHCHETALFNALDLQWRLAIYPKGNRRDKGKDHISLYLCIADTWDAKVPYPTVGRHCQVLRARQEVKKISHCSSRLLGPEESRSIWHFSKEQPTRGMAQALPLEEFEDTARGYLFNDCCNFGVEILPYRNMNKRETVTMLNRPSKGDFTFDFPYSKIDPAEGQATAIPIGGRERNCDIFKLDNFIPLANVPGILKGDTLKIKIKCEATSKYAAR